MAKFFDRWTGGAHSDTAPGPGPAAAGASRGYDEVRLALDDGERRLTRKAFEALPLVERVRALSSGTTRFFSQGQEMSPSRAMLD